MVNGSGAMDGSNMSIIINKYNNPPPQDTSNFNINHKEKAKTPEEQRKESQNTQTKQEGHVILTPELQ